MFSKVVTITLSVAVVFFCASTALAGNEPDDYIIPGRLHMFEQTLSGLREAYQTFDTGLNNPNCPDCDSSRELKFLHAVAGAAMVFIQDNNDSSIDSFLELAKEFGITVSGDSFDLLDINDPRPAGGCYHIPVDAPDINEVIHSSLIPQIDAVITELGTISDSDSDRFRIFFTPTETGLENNLEVDYAEVLILKGLLTALKSQLEMPQTYDVFVNINKGKIKTVLNTLLCSSDNGLDIDFYINNDLLVPYPNLLKILPTQDHPEDGEAVLAQAREDLINGIDYYFDALDYIQSEADEQEDDLVYIDANDSELMAILEGVNAKLTTARDSLENDTSGTYRIETTKTYNIYDSNSTLIGQLILVYDFTGFKGKKGSVNVNGIPGEWEVDSFGVVGSEIEVEVEYHSPTEGREGYFEGTMSSDGNSITGATFDYWGTTSGSLANLSGQLVSTEVADITVDLNPVFGNTARYPNPVNPRDLLSLFNKYNEPVAGTFGHGLGNDATLGGILPDMTQQDWTNLLELAASDLTGEFGTVVLPNPVVPGDKGKAAVTVTNGGDAIAVGKISIEIYASVDQTLDGNDVLLGKLVNRPLSLAPEISKSLTVNVAVPGNLLQGTYYLLAKIDSTNAIAESNEQNNTAVTNDTSSVMWKCGSFGSRTNVKLVVNDSHGVPVTFSLTGGGWAEIIGGANFDQIVLHNTTVKSQLLISTKGKGVETSVGDIIVGDSTDANGLKGIMAKTTTLRGNITVNGSQNFFAHLKNYNKN